MIKVRFYGASIHVNDGTVRTPSATTDVPTIQDAMDMLGETVFLEDTQVGYTLATFEVIGEDK